MLTTDTPPTPIPTLLVSTFVSSGSLITLYRETNGKTRGQLSGVPLSIVSSEHPSTNNTNGLTVNDDVGKDFQCGGSEYLLQNK
jgi:hypothetical protein